MEEIDYKLELEDSNTGIPSISPPLSSIFFDFLFFDPFPPILRGTGAYRGTEAQRTIEGGGGGMVRDSRHGDALKKTRVIWQSATLCHIKKAASSLNNVVPVISQSAFSFHPLATLASKKASHRTASPSRFGRNANGSRIWVASIRLKGRREEEGANSSIDEKQSGRGRKVRGGISFRSWARRGEERCR